jgi:hypothetical protein
MSEATYLSGDVQPCPYCTFKHLTDAEMHADFDAKVKETIKRLREDLAKKIDIDKASYDEIRRYEHILEDYLTVLREARKKLEPHRGCSGIVNPGENPNPQLAELEAQCSWVKEERKPSDYFHPESFRTLCPECPQARCALCPPEKACATRIVIGCPKGYWDEKTQRCLTSTEVHVIYHGRPKVT